MREEGLPLREAVARGSRERLAPVLMTALTAGLALIPLVLAGRQAGQRDPEPDGRGHPGRPPELDVPEPRGRAGAVRALGEGSHARAARARGEGVSAGGDARRAPAGVGFALGSALLFGLSTPCAKLLVGETPPLLLAGLLYAGSGLGLFIAWLAMPASAEEAPLARADVPWLAGAVVAGGILGPVLLMSGLRTTPGSAASLLLNLEGVFTALRRVVRVPRERRPADRPRLRAHRGRQPGPLLGRPVGRGLHPAGRRPRHRRRVSRVGDRQQPHAADLRRRPGGPRGDQGRGRRCRQPRARPRRPEHTGPRARWSPERWPWASWATASASRSSSWRFVTSARHARAPTSRSRPSSGPWPRSPSSASPSPAR